MYGNRSEENDYWGSFHGYIKMLIAMNELAHLKLRHKSLEVPFGPALKIT